MKNILILIVAMTLFGCNSINKQNTELKREINENEYFAFVKDKALEVVKTNFRQKCIQKKL